MSEEGPGSLSDEHAVGAAHGRVTSLEHRFDRFQESIEGSFREVNANIAEIAKNVERRFEVSRPDLAKLAGAATVVLAVAGAFISLAKSNLDTNITYTNQRVTDANTATDRLALLVEKLADRDTARFDRIVDKTIPKEQLEAQFKTLTDTQRGKVDRDVFNEATKLRETEVRELHDAVGKVEGDMIKRRDVEILIATMAARMDRIGAQVDDFQRKFIAVPAFPKYNDK